MIPIGYLYFMVLQSISNFTAGMEAPIAIVQDGNTYFIFLSR
jgi:hypothetical protein